MSYVAGNMESDANRLARGGWLVGVFFANDPEESTRTSSDLEAKYWRFERGGGQSHQTKTSSTIEFSIILKGRIRARLGDDQVLLAAGDYVLIQPDTPNNLVEEVLENVIGLTIKSPSDPAAKKILPPSA